MSRSGWVGNPVVSKGRFGMSPLPIIVKETKAFEAWLRQQCSVVQEGLDEKYEKMARNAFRFFRATCYRFAGQLPDLLPELVDAPKAPSVGDAHIENWGTWRDAEGRLIWGANDFDEAAILPYTYDLVRLATSTRLAKNLPIGDDAAIEAILAGYRAGLDAPQPFVVGAADWFQELLLDLHEKADDFNVELKGARKPETTPAKVMKLLTSRLPEETGGIKFREWQRGGGSLGRPRYLAIGKWQGGLVLREAKALVPSAWDPTSSNGARIFMAMARGRYRSPDPFLEVRHGYIVRRIAFDSHKIDLTNDREKKYHGKLLEKMGADLAAIHLSGGPGRKRIRDDLDARKWHWLHDAAQIAADAVKTDYDAWTQFYNATPRGTWPK